MTGQVAKEALNGPELRYFLHGDHLPELYSRLEHLGLVPVVFRERYVQTIYCSTADLTTPKTSNIRLRRYSQSATNQILPSDLVVVEAKHKGTSNKFRQQLGYQRAVELLQSPLELFGQAGSSPIIRADWPQGQDGTQTLEATLQELEYRPLYPVAGTITYRSHYVSQFGARATVDAKIIYLGVYRPDVSQLVFLGDEADVCKVELKGVIQDCIVGPIDDLITRHDGRPIGNNEQEIKMRQLYLQHLHQCPDKVAN